MPIVFWAPLLRIILYIMIPKQHLPPQVIVEYAPYINLKTLLNKPAHLSVFLNYTILENKPNNLVRFLNYTIQENKPNNLVKF